MDSFTSQEWIDLLKLGDESALEELWESLFRWAYDSARRRGLEEDLARDAAVDAYTRIMDKLDSFEVREGERQSGSFRNWCRVIVLNQVRHRRDKRRLQIVDPSVDDLEPFLPGEVLEELLPSETDYQPLLDCLHRLSERQMTLIVGIYLRGLTSEQMAQRLGITRNNVNVTLYHARHNLRHCLEKQGILASEDLTTT